MADSESLSGKPKSSSLDLSSLQNISLGPKWESGSLKDSSSRGSPVKKDSFTQRSGSASPGGPRKDRRPARRQTVRREDSPERREESAGFFQPVVDVQFYPEEEPFKVLIQAVRNSLRTFELFEIARLILEKPERFVCLVKDPRQKEGEPPLLYASVPDGLPFRDENAALNHVFKVHLGSFCDVETVEVDPPTGSFPIIHRCGITGDLIGPPNYHRYSALLKAHHANKVAHVPFERFQQKIESVKDEEATQQWLEGMKQQTRYTLKVDEGVEAKTFDNLEDLRLYLVTQSKDKLVRPAYSARFSGKDFSLLDPQDPIRRSLDFHWQRQLKFPLDTANHLRGRLRRLNFAVYKKGSKGVSYVCAVKRNFRVKGQTLADNLEDLLAFVEAHPMFPAKNLPKGYLGIGDGKVNETEMDDAEKLALKSLKVDLRYLISEGYLIEYSDGRLYVPPVKEVENPPAKPVQAAKEKKIAEAEKKVSPDSPPVVSEVSIHSEETFVKEEADSTDVKEERKVESLAEAAEVTSEKGEHPPVVESDNKEKSAD